MTTIEVILAGKKTPMLLEDSKDVAPNMAAIMAGDGWVPMVFFAKRPKGRKSHLVYKSAKSGHYVSILSL